MTQALCLPTVYLNGDFMPIEEAKISPLDRGFIFGDGVYEVIPGLIETEMSSVSKAHYDAEIERGWLVTPRWGRPEEVARTVSTLALGLLPYTVGQAIKVDGGMLINRY